MTFSYRFIYVVVCTIEIQVNSSVISWLIILRFDYWITNEKVDNDISICRYTLQIETKIFNSKINLTKSNE